jgi:Putative zinc-finger
VSHLGQRLSALIDGELSHPQRERVLAHLARCEPCRHEAAALRTLKQRMHALGEATADAALTDRLIAMAALTGPPSWRRRLPLARRWQIPASPRRRRPVRSLAMAGLAVAGLGVPAAAFLIGGSQPEPGPSVTPAVGAFMMQHEISAGEVPATASPGAPSAPAASTPQPSPHSAVTAAPGVTAAPAVTAEASSHLSAAPAAPAAMPSGLGVLAAAPLPSPAGVAASPAPPVRHGHTSEAGRAHAVLSRSGSR